MTVLPSRRNTRPDAAHTKANSKTWIKQFYENDFVLIAGAKVVVVEWTNSQFLCSC